MVAHLLARHADPALKDVYHATPTFAAMRHGHQKALRALVAAYPQSLTEKDALGRTPMKWAEMTGPNGLIELANELRIEHGLENEVPEVYVNVPFALHIPKGPSDHTCAVCTCNVIHCTYNMNCTICFDDAFLLCNSCVGAGMMCLDASHKESSWAKGCKNCRLFS